jgi:ElaB/YqjD/DUF883 family membrane-anchored ribosome-binding protein
MSSSIFFNYVSYQSYCEKENAMAEDPIRKELDAIKADIAQLRLDIGGLTDVLKGAAADKIDDTKSRAQQTTQDAWADLESKLDEVLQQGRAGIDNVEDEIRQHPTGSLLTAFGLGFIIAKLLDVGGRR